MAKVTNHSSRVRFMPYQSAGNEISCRTLKLESLSFQRFTMDLLPCSHFLYSDYNSLAGAFEITFLILLTWYIICRQLSFV